MVGDVRLKGTNRLQQFPVLGAAPVNVQRIGQFVDNLQCPIDLAMPQVPLQVLQRLLQVGAQFRVVLAARTPWAIRFIVVTRMVT
jgi:hypothetical protein